MPQAIIFDFDGVLVDSEPLHYRAFLRTAKEQGFDVDFTYETYLKRYVGFDDRDGFRAMLEDAGALAATAGPGAESRAVAVDAADEAVAGLCAQKQRVFNTIVAEGVALVPGVLELLASLPAGLPVAVASGATREDIDLILAAINLTDRFEVIVSATDVTRSKPDPETYRSAFEQLAARHKGVAMSPARCLAIEDTPTGIASARAAGLQTLAIETTTSRSELMTAHRVVEGLEGVAFDTLVEWFGE